MLDRAREPRADVDEEPSLRGVAEGASLAFEAAEGVSSTRRRNCELFIALKRQPREVI